MLYLDLYTILDTSVNTAYTLKYIGINQVFKMTFKTRVLDSSQTSPELNQPNKCKLVLVDAHQD
jgi:hypothetical protein